MIRPERHSFVTLKPEWRAFAPTPSACATESTAWNGLSDWIDRTRPLVVASSAPGDDLSSIRLGCATPGKQRIGVLVAQGAIQKAMPAISLAEARDVAPEDWWAMIDDLLELAADHGLRLAVFGSLAWQYMTGLTYIHPASDLDLLVRTEEGQDCRDVIQAMLAFTDGPRLDGELLLANGGAVNLREYAGPADELLEKRHGGARLISRSRMDITMGVC